MDENVRNEDFGTVSPEQNEAVATEIYNKLQGHRGRAHLSGFNNGNVIYPEKARRIEIVRLAISVAFEQEMFRQRGFTDKDISSGITTIIESKFLNPDWPRTPFKQEPRLRYINVSQTGKTVEAETVKVGGGAFHPAQLNLTHFDALQRLAYLSMVPRQILEVFESYGEFKKVLKKSDFAGIDTSEMTPTQILYDGGLGEFIRALELKKKGGLSKLDSSLHELKDSLDDRDHFTKLLETLQRAKESGENRGEL